MKLYCGIPILALLVLFGCDKMESKKTEASRPVISQARTISKAEEAHSFCRSKNYNTDFCILIDMSLHSGINRLVVWDFKKKSIAQSCLVSHGCCGNPWSMDFSREKAGFSNIDGSHCTSLGKFRIGDRGYSQWGVNVKYVLHGLESSNRNALKRAIVFHSWHAISDKEVYPDGCPEGWGCPAISNYNFKMIDPLIKSSSRPVLMWIYN